MLINPSRDIVVSLACYSCSMLVRLEGFNGDFLLKFLEFKYERNRVHFSPYEFFYYMYIGQSFSQLLTMQPRFYDG